MEFRVEELEKSVGDCLAVVAPAYVYIYMYVYVYVYYSIYIYCCRSRSETTMTERRFIGQFILVGATVDTGLPQKMSLDRR